MTLENATSNIEVAAHPLINSSFCHGKIDEKRAMKLITPCNDVIIHEQNCGNLDVAS